MGTINLLKNGYQGKLGETVGQKWKNQMTVRTYQPTNNSKSEAQLDQRSHYKELITEASTLYPYARGWPKNAEKKMNSFNHFTSTLEEIRKRNSPYGLLDPLNVFNKKGVWHPMAYTGLFGDALIVLSSPILSEENIKKVRLVTFFAPQTGLPQTQFNSETVAGSLQPVEPPSWGGNVVPRKGWLLTLSTTAQYQDNLYLALKIPYKGKIYYSVPNTAPWQQPEAQDIGFQATGDAFDLYFN